VAGTLPWPGRPTPGSGGASVGDHQPAAVDQQAGREEEELGALADHVALPDHDVGVLMVLAGDRLVQMRTRWLPVSATSTASG